MKQPRRVLDIPIIEFIPSRDYTPQRALDIDEEQRRRAQRPGTLTLERQMYGHQIGLQLVAAAQTEAERLYALQLLMRTGSNSARYTASAFLNDGGPMSVQRRRADLPRVKEHTTGTELVDNSLQVLKLAGKLASAVVVAHRNNTLGLEVLRRQYGQLTIKALTGIAGGIQIGDSPVPERHSEAQQLVWEAGFDMLRSAERSGEPIGSFAQLADATSPESINIQRTAPRELALVHRAGLAALTA